MSSCFRANGVPLSSALSQLSTLWYAMSHDDLKCWSLLFFASRSSSHVTPTAAHGPLATSPQKPRFSTVSPFWRPSANEAIVRFGAL